MSAGGGTDPWPYWRIMKSTAGSGIEGEEVLPKEVNGN